MFLSFSRIKIYFRDPVKRNHFPLIESLLAFVQGLISVMRENYSIYIFKYLSFVEYNYHMNTIILFDRMFYGRLILNKEFKLKNDAA